MRIIFFLIAFASFLTSKAQEIRIFESPVQGSTYIRVVEERGGVVDLDRYIPVPNTYIWTRSYVFESDTFRYRIFNPDNHNTSSGYIFLREDAKRLDGTTYTLEELEAFLEQHLSFSSGGGASLPTQEHVFQSTADRDTYFTANPEDLEFNLPIFVSIGGLSELQYWTSGTRTSYDSGTDKDFWATANMDGLSATQVKTLYESNSNTNAFTDALLSRVNNSVQAETLETNSIVFADENNILQSSPLRVQEPLTQEGRGFVTLDFDSDLNLMSKEINLGDGFTFKDAGSIPTYTDNSRAETFFNPYQRIDETSISDVFGMKSLSAYNYFQGLTFDVVPQQITSEFTWIQTLISAGFYRHLRFRTDASQEAIQGIRLQLFKANPINGNLLADVSSLDMTFDVEAGANDVNLDFETFFLKADPVNRGAERLHFILTIPDGEILHLRGEIVSNRPFPLSNGFIPFLGATNRIADISEMSFRDELYGKNFELTEDFTPTIQTVEDIQGAKIIARNQEGNLNVNFSEQVGFGRGTEFAIKHIGEAENNGTVTLKSDNPSFPLSISLEDGTIVNELVVGHNLYYLLTYYGNGSIVVDHSNSSSNIGGSGIEYTTPPINNELVSGTGDNSQAKGTGIVLVSSDGVLKIPSTSIDNPASALLPDGIFRFNEDVVIENPVNFETELSGITIEEGEAFLIEQDGEILGLLVKENDAIVAIKDNPSLTTEGDWLIVENTQNEVVSALFQNSITRNGGRLDLNDNVFVNEANVVIQRNESANLPQFLPFVSANSNVEETANLGSPPFRFTNLTGGSLTLEYQVSGSSTGFDPEFREIKFDYGNGIVFTFNIRNLGIDGVETATIQIPFQDYSSALNQDPAVTLTYFERGVQFLGNLTVISLVNTNKGTLHDPIIDLINEVTDAEVLAIQSDISDLNTKDNALSTRISANEQIANNPILQVNREVASVFVNNTKVTEEDNVQKIASPLNLQLGGGNVAGAIQELSNIIENSEAERIGKKLYYLPTPTSGALLSANNINLVERNGSSIVVKQFVSAIPSGTYTQTHYPSPENQIGYEGNWFLMLLENNHITPVASSISLINEIPTTATNVTIETQILANGSNYDLQSHTLLVGGGDTSISFIETQGGESIDVTIRYQASSRSIIIEAEPHIDNGGFAIDDLQIRASWTSQETSAGTPETTRDVYFGSANDQTQVIATKIINGNVFLVSKTAEVDTRRTATSLLGTNFTGFFVTTNSVNFDLNFDANTSVMTTLYDNRENAFFGLFTNQYTHNSFLEFDTQVRVMDQEGNEQNALDHVQDVNGKTIKANIIEDGNGGYQISFEEL